ncbi:MULTISPECIES: uracil-DNA glycosylase [unclassified Lentimicrobium]|uniref:uracil-DNA glycosylase n=1 Tax=unclassified Lentimicrobium TaxID=2677434 RepID=UPI00155644BE|nr:MULTISPECIES: uracil-DNA glycosylase [unclassified Lentimicrobium]NPD45280.1 uracil-DNA glycosylase [Lentimicrobium sp. S6]NPD86503.1 uracil-DNA glycosylase [Lentimicrobium sp. L6]
MSSTQVDIHPEWFEVLEDQFESEYFRKLRVFLIEEKKKYQIFPPGKEIFSAFNETPFSKTNVIILGQDPYHGPDQANGMCFSVKDGIPHPPSLKNIFKEIRDDFGFPIPQSGDLTPWAKQGVLLINATLTVRAGQAGSHQKKGWEEFTDTIIKRLSEQREGLIFLLWGNFAIAKSKLIDQEKHHILTSVHPSPLSAYRGFLGCKHFSKTNELLKSMGKEPVNWKIK